MAKGWEKVAAENLIRNVSGTYYLNAKVSGKKIRVSLQTKVLKVAKTKRDAKLSLLRATTAKLAGAIRTVGDALALVESRETSRPNLKPRSVEYYEAVFKLLRETLPVSRAGQAVTKDDLAAWWKALTGNRAATQCNDALRMVRKVTQALREAHVRFDDPAAELKRMRKKKSAVEKLPKRADFLRVVERIRGTKKAKSEVMGNLVEFLAWSGCRIGEARAVEWAHVEKHWLMIHGGEDGTKGGEYRRVPINEPLRAVLDSMRYDGAVGFLFSVKSPREALRRACEHCQIPHLRVHDLRHLFATVAVESGVDIPTVSRWLGHKDGGALAMRTYGHLRDDHSLDQAKKLR